MSKKKSIKTRLFTSLSVLIALSLLLVNVITFFNTKHDIEEVFQGNLKNSELFGNHVNSHLIDDEENELTFKILVTLSLTLAASFIPLLIIIWVTINKGLAPLTKILEEIEKISPTNLTLIKKEENLPKELEPLIDSINALLIRLTESLEAEKRFVDYAAHELRTPLSAIKTQTQLLLKKNRKKGDKELQKDLESLIAGVDRTVNLANQLLILARIDPENTDSDVYKVNFKNILEKVLANYYKAAAKKKINFKIKATDCSLTINETYLEIALGNLIDNAIKYGKINSEIVIKLQKTDKEILFNIASKGKTLNEEQKERIFDKFYRVNNSIASGSGLGLAIVKKIVELHSGKIEFTDKNSWNEFSLIFSV